ncbi:transposase [Planctomycetales bacterium]|nr:transposase [Planctomycetales bacterium]
MRKTFTAEFKARVGLEAVRGEKTVQEIGTLYEVHPNQVSDWKKQVLSGAAKLFAKKERAKADAAVVERREQALYAQVGKLSVQVEFLKKSIGNCSGASRTCRAVARAIDGRRAMRIVVDIVN